MTQSSKYGGGNDTYESLVDENYVMTGTTTRSEANSFIMATFPSAVLVRKVYISHVSSSFPGGFGCSYSNGMLFQYSNDNANWTTLQTISGLIEVPMYITYDVNVTARYFRVHRPSGYCALGTFIFV